jgi:hypothetical protein
MSNVNLVILIIGIYVAGYIISLYLLKTYAKEWDMDGHGKDGDPNSRDMYDYTSNAHAYTAYSSIWPLFYLFGILIWLNRKLVESTKKYLKK